MNNIYPFYEPQRDVVHDLNCNYRKINNITPHFHQAIEITCVLSGTVNFFVGGKSKLLSAGDIAFTPPYSVHYTQSAEDVTAVVLIVPKRYFEQFMKATDGASYSFLMDKEKNADIFSVIHEIGKRDKISNMPEILRNAYANMVLGLILERYEPEIHSDIHQDIAVEIISYIDEHFREEITLDKISAHFGYSKYYFSRLFNRIFSCNLNTFVNSVRARAIDKDNSNENKTKVIMGSGFNSLSSYYRFKK